MVIIITRSRLTVVSVDTQVSNGAGNGVCMVITITRGERSANLYTQILDHLYCTVLVLYTTDTPAFFTC